MEKGQRSLKWPHVGHPLVVSTSLLLNIAIEIVDLPIQNGDFPSFFPCLPEGHLRLLWGAPSMTTLQQAAA